MRRMSGSLQGFIGIDLSNPTHDGSPKTVLLTICPLATPDAENATISCISAPFMLVMNLSEEKQKHNRKEDQEVNASQISGIGSHITKHPNGKYRSNILQNE